MIKSTKATYLRTSLLLLSFALLLFITACGGSMDDSDAESAKGGTISLAATSSSVSAGQSSIITVTVLDGAGGFAKNESVTFTIIDNKSGATITPLNNGKTDAKGQAIATYKAGSNNPGSEVQDSIQASISGATNVIIITRTSASSTAYQLSLTADSTTITPGTTTIVRATVTDGGGNAVYGQAVTFSFLSNKSAATLTTLSLGATDTSGQALAIYTAGTATPTQSVQDTIQASIAGATGVVIITRSAGGTSASGLLMTLNADAPSLTAGQSTIVRAKVTDGSGTAVQGQAVSFTFISNQSGGTINALNSGITDASGQAIATYTAGASSPTASVQDTIQASLTGTVAAIIISRTAGGGTSAGLILTLTAASTTVEGGESTILTAKVTNGSGSPVQGEAVNFGFAPGGNQSGAAINVLSGTTDAAGEATALYAAGSLTGATVQDIVQASITGSTKAIIITKTGTASGVTAASIYLSASPTSVKSDGSTTSTISVKALNSLNAEISGVVVAMETNTGILSAPTVTTPGTVTFTSGADKANPTATIIGRSGSVSGQVTVQIVGSTVTVTASSSSISAPTPASSTPLTITVKDAGGNGISGAAVVLSQSPTGGIGSGSVTITDINPSSGLTNTSGILTATATGLTQGAVTITAEYRSTTGAIPVSGTTNLTVTLPGSAFAIENQYLDGSVTPVVDADGNPNPDPTSVSINAIGTPYTPHSLKLVVNAPGVTTVRFATTLGSWDSTTNKVVDVAVGSTGDGAGKVSATLTSTNIGIANVQVYNIANPTINDTLTVAMASGAAPGKILLQASSTVVPVSVGTTTYSSTLTATVYDSSTSNNPLVGQTVAFEIVNGTSTSGGETISPVVVMTNSSGQAKATFNSGSMPSAGSGVQIRASVVGTAVRTGLSPSGNDVAIVIGGTAGSIAFGWDSKAGQDSTNANYTYKMSVLVADSNGNPVAGALVSLGAWPIAWSDGVGCIPTQFYVNEDNTVDATKENMILDTDEDGRRIEFDMYAPSYKGFDHGVDILKKDTRLTPVNSAGGTVPATVTTDANGVAGFTLTYPKSSGSWIYDRIRATTMVQGTETRADTLVYLKIVVGEEVICAESPFRD